MWDVSRHMAMSTSRARHGSRRRMALALLAALTSVSLVAQERQASGVLVVREPLGLTPDQESRLAEVIGSLFPDFFIQALPATSSERRATLGLSFQEAFDIAGGNQVALQTVRDRECQGTSSATCGADLPVRARSALDRYDDLASQTLEQLAQTLRRAGDVSPQATVVYVSSGLPFRVDPRRGFEAVRKAARESPAALIVVDAHSAGRDAAGLARLAEVTQADRFGVSPDDRLRLRTKLAAQSTVQGRSRAQPLGSSALPRGTRSVPAVLQVAMQHAVKFAEQAASILADERTLQEVKVRPSATSLSPGSNAGIRMEQRVLDSEVALVHVGGRDLWLLARDVLRVNGAEVPDADRIRLPLVHPTSAPEALRQFEQVARQGSRFNIGGIERNVNTPTLALWLLTPDVSPRLVFSNAGTARVDGRVCDVIAFRERSAPYLFAVAGTPAPVSGRFWVDRGRAAVVKTDLSLPEESIEWTPSRARVTVAYAFDPTLSAWVPRTMSERYDSLSSRQFVVAQSTYANFRMFRVASRIIK